MSEPAQLSVRLIWSVADQGASSLSTLALTVLVARVSSPSTFGAFALAFGALPVVIMVMRAMACDPMAIRHGREEEPTPIAAVTGFAIAIGLIAGILLLGVAVLTNDALRSMLIVVGLFVPAVLLHDAARAALLVLGRPAAAAVDNVLRLGVHLAGSAVLITSDHATAISLSVLWCAVTAATGVVGLIQLRVLPTVMSGRRWLREQRDLWPSLLAEQFVMTGTWQVALVVLAAVVGVSATAGIRGALTIFGPITMLHLALPFTMIPVLGRRLRTKVDVPGALKSMMLISIGLAVGALIATGALLVLPDVVGQQVLGESWGQARGVLLPFGLYVSGAGVSQVAILGVRSLAAVRSAVRASLMAGLLLLVGTVVGSVADGATGFAVGLAIATWAAAMVWWFVFFDELREPCRG